MAKIEIYAEQRHTVVGVLASAIFGVLVSFAVVFYTLFFQNALSPLVYGISQFVLYVFSIGFVIKIVVNYRDDLRKMSDMIETVKEGKELPKLEELSQWKKG